MAFTFNAKGYSDSGLIMMHDGIHKAHKADSNTPSGQEGEYGVYDFADWKIQSDEIESELAYRKVKFSPVPW